MGRPQQYSKVIKQIREKNGLSQAEFAKKLGKAQTTISAWEIGRNKPSHAEVLRINQVFGTDLKPQYDYIAYSAEINGALDQAARAEREIRDRANYVIESMGNRAADIRLLTYLDALNPAGVREALKRVSELTEIPRYKKGAHNGNGEEEGQ